MAELPPSGFVKICGVTSVDDARFVVNAGASALGLIFANSVREVHPDQAKAIAQATNGELLRTAVFRDHSDDEIISILDDVDVEIVQLHDDVSADLLENLRQRALLIVRALSIGSDAFGDFDEASVDAVLIDGQHPGSGADHGWEELSARSFSVPVIAAGGLRPGNVADVISSLSIWGVDCASGVEQSAGVKDEVLVREFVKHARDAFARSGS